MFFGKILLRCSLKVVPPPLDLAVAQVRMSKVLAAVEQLDDLISASSQKGFNMKKYLACSRTVLLLLCTLMLLANIFVASAQQGPTSFDRERGRLILRTIKDDLRKNYYDQTFHGLDLESHFKSADEKIKTATSLGQIFGILPKL